MWSQDEYLQCYAKAVEILCCSAWCLYETMSDSYTSTNQYHNRLSAEVDMNIQLPSVLSQALKKFAKIQDNAIILLFFCFGRFLKIILCTFKIYFKSRETGTNSKFPPAVSFPKWFQKPGLCENKAMARSSILMSLMSDRGPSTSVICCCQTRLISKKLQLRAVMSQTQVFLGCRCNHHTKIPIPHFLVLISNMVNIY